MRPAPDRHEARAVVAAEVERLAADAYYHADTDCDGCPACDPPEPYDPLPALGALATLDMIARLGVPVVAP